MRGLRIFIIAQQGRGAGAASVCRNLATSIVAAGAEDQFAVTIPSAKGYEGLCDQSWHCQVHLAKAGEGRLARIAEEVALLPRLVRSFRPDVVLALGDRGLLHPPCPQAILVHRSQLFYPRKHYEAETLGMKLVFRLHSLQLRASLPKTGMVLCQTETAGKRLRQHYGYRGKIHIVPNSLSRSIARLDGVVEEPAALRPYSGRFKLLVLARYYAHKNLEGLIELFAKRGEMLDGVVAFTTVAETQHPRAREFLRKVKRAGLSDRIVNLGPIPQADLPSYYRSCDALFLPTLLESFSGTYVEAMALGTPIITSDLDFARDVCGEAALYCDPWSEDSMARAIVTLKGDPLLRARLVEAGKRRFEEKLRSWEDIAQELLAVLHQYADANELPT